MNPNLDSLGNDESNNSEAESSPTALMERPDRDGHEELSYSQIRVLGRGTFGEVIQAKLHKTGELVAIKKVYQDKKYENRELDIMRRLDHCNIVELKYFFYSREENKDGVNLNLVLECIPSTVYEVARHYAKNKLKMPVIYIKIYIYQLFRALAYIHSMDICHRDIKPQNLLLDPETSVLKLCDFGSAKKLTQTEKNVSYICSRFYRAPELILDAKFYTTKIDVWSAGCVLAELFFGRPIFVGNSCEDQLAKIMMILGTPTRDEIIDMNPNYTELQLPKTQGQGWENVFQSRPVPQEATALLSDLLKYRASERLTSLQSCAHSFFDELRNGNGTLPNGCKFPPLFNFTEHELSIDPSLNANLMPLNSSFASKSNESNYKKN